MLSRSLWVVVVVSCALALAGCGQGDQGEPRITAKNIGHLQIWRSNVSSRYNAETWRELDAALQELRWRELARDPKDRHGTVDAALCEQIDGRTVPEVVRLGYEAKLARLEPLRAELQRMIDANALMVPKPGDATVADSLAQIRSKQQDRMQAMMVEIDATKRRLAELSPNMPEEAAASAGSAAGAAPLPREQALAEINSMIAARRGTAEIRYGAWPIRVDPAGLLLKGEDKDKLVELQAQALQNGHSIIPVQLKGRWWFYDAKIDQPEFSAAVMANLTASDRREIARRWANSEAEIWARREARDVDGTEATMAAAKPKLDKVPVQRPTIVPTPTPSVQPATPPDLPKPDVH